MDNQCKESALAQTAVEQCSVLSNESSRASALGTLVLEAPRCARAVKPGQFVHLALPAFEAHILRRPLSVYQADAEAGTISLLYQAVGAGTEHLFTLEPGMSTSIIGPVGRGWSLPGVTGNATSPSCLLIGGGVGAAPLYLLAKQLLAHEAQVHVVLGARTEVLLACEGAYAELVGAENLRVTTDDGRRGHKGFVTEVAEELLQAHQYDYLATCGPEPMQKAVVSLAKEFDVPCEVSLERRMACGLGACLSCVIDTSEGKKRVCVDGPVFNAQEVIW